MKMKKSSIRAKAKAKVAAKSQKTPRGRMAAGKRSSAKPTAQAVPGKPAARPMPGPRDTETAQILRELKEIRALLREDEPVTLLAEEALEGGVDSLRRLLSDVIEKRTEWILSRLVVARAAVSDGPRLARELDKLIEELGARPFNAQPLDHVDPLIHCVMEERKANDMPEGVVLETLTCGYRASSGRVLAKAGVAVSRRS